MEWLRRHWIAVLGMGSLVLPIFKAIGAVLTRAGDIDFVVERTANPGWVGDVLNWLFDPPGWIIVPMIVAGLAFIYVDFQRSLQRLSGPSPSSARADQAAAPPRPSDGSHNWDALYEVNNGKIRLRFVPDTDKSQTDTLLLVLYGYKLLLSADRVRIAAAHNEVRRALLEAPNRRTGPLAALDSIHLAAPIDFGRAAIDDGYLERVSLSEGGLYRLTADGERYARRLALDLVRRA